MTRFLLLLLLASGANAGAAEPASPSEEGRALVEAFIGGVETMQGRFEQSLVDANDRVVETSAGTFEIRRPGRFRWTYAEPYEQILVADGRNVWSYDVDLAQVTVKPQAEVLGSTPALLLGGADEVLEDFTVVDSFEDRGTTWVRLVPEEAASSFSSVELGFTAGRLSRMIFTDNLEQTTLVALFDVQLNEPVDPSRFEFTAPPGVDVVGEPAPAADIPRTP
jgi:outer membrane lipoprotein carrier protein